ncbi:MAG: phage holin family protein [Actinomycetota bacterium]|nr:phage holin family protein [Actinomycetota bacterium]
MAHEDLNDRSISDLLQRLSQQTQTLVRDEIRLALLELQDKGKRAGLGAGLFGASGLIALFGVATLIAAAVLLLATAIEAWLAALIVAVALLGAAGLLALGGKKEIEQAIPPAPTEAIESTKDDVEAVKEHVGHRSERMARR